MMNDVTRPPPALPGVDEETVRLRAYELWERGGRRRDHDRDDWFAAEASLRQQEASDSSVSPIAKGAVDAIADGLQGMTTLATGAMAAVAGLFGASQQARPESAPPQAAHSAEAEAIVAAPALATEETAVLLVQDKRIRDAKVVAEATSAAKPAGPVNPDG